jgi:hypothetical protein
LSQPLSAACTYQDWITRLSTEFGFDGWCEHRTAEFGTEFRRRTGTPRSNGTAHAREPHPVLGAVVGHITDLEAIIGDQ